MLIVDSFKMIYSILAVALNHYKLQLKKHISYILNTFYMPLICIILFETENKLPLYIFTQLPFYSVSYVRAEHIHFHCHFHTISTCTVGQSAIWHVGICDHATMTVRTNVQHLFNSFVERNNCNQWNMSEGRGGTCHITNWNPNTFLSLLFARDRFIQQVRIDVCSWYECEC